MPVAADGLGGLQQMLDLRKVGIGIAVVHQRVQILHGFPDTHAALVEREIFAFFLPDEIAGLMGMVQAVELADHRRSLGCVLPELCFLTVGVVPASDEIVPLIEAFERTPGRGLFHILTISG